MSLKWTPCRFLYCNLWELCSEKWSVISGGRQWHVNLRSRSAIVTSLYSQVLWACRCVHWLHPWPLWPHHKSFCTGATWYIGLTWLPSNQTNDTENWDNMMGWYSVITYWLHYFDGFHLIRRCSYILQHCGRLEIRVSKHCNSQSYDWSSGNIELLDRSDSLDVHQRTLWYQTVFLFSFWQM